MKLNKRQINFPFPDGVETVDIDGIEPHTEFYTVPFEVYGLNKKELMNLLAVLKSGELIEIDKPFGNIHVDRFNGVSSPVYFVPDENKVHIYDTGYINKVKGYTRKAFIDELSKKIKNSPEELEQMLEKYGPKLFLDKNICEQQLKSYLIDDL